jgi:hypothetical protein
MIFLDIVLMAAISATIIGFLAWSIVTQHRDYGCTHLRIRRRSHASVRLITSENPELARELSTASQI